MRVIYVAGPISADDAVQVCRNQENGKVWAARLMEIGYAPYCPMLDGDLVGRTDMRLDQVYEYSMEFLRRSDAVFCIEGWEHSRGTKAEIGEANSLNIPVYYSIEELTAHLPPA